MTKKEIGIGIIGHTFMGQAHSLGLHEVATVAAELGVRPRLVTMCGRDTTTLTRDQQRFDWENIVTDWRDIVADPRVQVVDNAAPNALHAETMIAAAEAGKHLFCEKPLARTADEAFRMWNAAEQAGVVHMTAFNYRFFPALQLARQMIQSGELGTIHHYRSVFLDPSAVDPANRKTPWRFQRAIAGSGAIGDIGAHHIDLARFLVGEPVTVAATVRTFVSNHGGTPVDVDDAFAALVDFDTGATGTLEASRAAGGQVNCSRIEVDGSKGSLIFDVQHLNHLRVGYFGEGFRDILVTERHHPYGDWWFPSGHPLGWGDSFTHEWAHMLDAVAHGNPVAPIGATFEDGYRCAEVCDAIMTAGKTGHRVAIGYRSLDTADTANHPQD